MNSWMNDAGEPIMDGAAWRFEQQLDMDSRDDYYADHFYDEDEDFDDDERDDTPFLTDDYDFHNEESAMEDAAMEFGLFGDC